LTAATPTTPAGSSDVAYDPGDHTVAEVIAYAAVLTPTELAELRDREAAGRNRSTLLAGLEAMS